MKRQNRFALTVSVIVCFATTLQAADWKDALKDKFRSTYTFAKRPLTSMDKISEPGTVLVIRKDGVSGDLATDATYSPVTVRNGAISQTGGGVIGFLANKKTTYIFKPGERVYLIDIKVDDDKIGLFLMALDTTAVSLNGSTRQTRYKAAVVFPYDKKTLPNMAFEDIQRDVEAVFAPESVVQSANTKTLSLNQTPQEVEAVLGKPETVINLGSKTTYVYKAMKVIFTDGKVSDVQ